MHLWKRSLCQKLVILIVVLCPLQYKCYDLGYAHASVGLYARSFVLFFTSHTLQRLRFKYWYCIKLCPNTSGSSHSPGAAQSWRFCACPLLSCAELQIHAAPAHASTESQNLSCSAHEFWPNSPALDALMAWSTINTCMHHPTCVCMMHILPRGKA